MAPSHLAPSHLAGELARRGRLEGGAPLYRGEQARRLNGYFVALAAVFAIALVPATAHAHKLNVYAEVRGTAIHGEAYFAGQVPAQDAAVEAFAPDGRKLAETKTSAEGRFTIEAKHRCAYRLVVNAGSGHGGQYTLPAEDLPESLPPLDAAAGTSPPKPPAEKPSPPPEAKPPRRGPASVPTADPQVLTEMVEKAVERRVAPLERRLREYEDRVRVSDVLGGIGYIVGVTGILFYALGVRKKRRLEQDAADSARLPKS